MVALFGGWIYAVILAGVYLAGGWQIGLTLYLAAFAAVTAILSAVLYTWLKRKGSRIFASLSA